MPDYQREEHKRRRRLLGYEEEEQDEPFRMTTGSSLRFSDEDD
jgi:hypothetical protein